MSRPDDSKTESPIGPGNDDLAFAETSSETPSGELRERAECQPSHAAPVPSDPFVGRCLAGRYRIEGRIGQGGMGTVYRARHETLDKPIAVKVIRGDLAKSSLNVARFEREAKAAASLDHEHVVDVIDYGHTEDGVAYMVMELLEGRTLDQVLATEGPLAPGRAVAIAWQIAKGLREAHGGGVIHRDLKAPNVFLVERDGHDHVKLLDFGISKMRESTEDDVKLTSTGVVMGTPNYLSPEQAKGEKDLDHRVDIYALGVIFFEMLTGKLPFDGTNVLELAYKHISSEPPVPSQVRQNIPKKLDEVVLRCLAKEPTDRYQSAPEFIAALPDPATLSGGWTLLSHLPGSSGALSYPVPGRTGFRRAMTLTLLAGALLGGSVVAICVFHPPPRPPWVPADGSPIVGITSSVSTGDGSPDASEHQTGPEKDGDVAVRVTPDADLSRDASDPDDGKVLLQVLPYPDHATVFLGSKRLGRGYQELRIDRGHSPQELVIKAPGYETATRPFVPSRDVEVMVELQRIAGGAAPVAPPPVEDAPPTQPPVKTGPSEVKANPYGP
jgi:serine/threonine protein kinase